MSRATETKLERIAAFSDGNQGGNPAGVMIGDRFPPDPEMQRIAAELGYSETAFAVPLPDGWRVRYFAPLGEVAFCGHATIALGASLTRHFGDGTYALQLNDAEISVQGTRDGDRVAAALISPPTHSRAVDDHVRDAALALFSLTDADLDPALPAAIANAGNDHLILALRHRSRLAGMAYDLTRGAAFMGTHGFTTISLLWAQTPRRFHSRNAFAIGGVFEDPATGAAAAALAGYLRDIGWPHGNSIEIIQGEDMGARSLLHAEIGDVPGTGIRVSGATRHIG